jgi:dihydroneopterin aldolase
MTIRSKLMEHLAGRILYAVFNNFPTVNAISITIIKENPPVNSDCDGCGINISVTREEFLSFYFS